MISQHDEIEAKLRADEVSVVDFKRFMIEMDVEEYRHIVSPDKYYEQGNHIIRHRIDQKRGSEITVKRRKSTSSTRDRQEIDLGLVQSVTPGDVDAWLQALGFIETLSIVKEAFIFWVKLTLNVKASFVLYDVYLVEAPNQKKRFVEVEIEKGSDVTLETAKKHLSAWVQKLRTQFKLEEPLNQSLFEIYSGRSNSLI